MIQNGKSGIHSQNINMQNKLWTCGHGSKYLLYYFIYFSGKSPSVGQCLISLNLTRTKAHTQNCKNQDTFPLWHALHRSLDCQHLKKLLLDFQISVRVSLKSYSPKLTLFKFSDELIRCSYLRILNLRIYIFFLIFGNALKYIFLNKQLHWHFFVSFDLNQ